MNQNELSLLIGGEAGQGVESAGHILGLSFARAGLNVFAMNEFASRIRGGHNFHKVRVSEEEVFGHLDHCNIIVALNQDTINQHIADVSDGGMVIYDSEDKIDASKYEHSVEFAEVPMRKIAVDISGKKVMENTVALGFVLGLLDFELDIFKGEAFGFCHGNNTFGTFSISQFLIYFFANFNCIGLGRSKGVYFRKRG